MTSHVNELCIKIKRVVKSAPADDIFYSIIFNIKNSVVNVVKFKQ